MTRRLRRIYWKIRYFLEDKYFENKYSKLKPQIYYDRMHKIYVNPVVIKERSKLLELVCEETARTGLLYCYNIGEKDLHDHSFAPVLQAAYNYAEQFFIPVEYEDEYSVQELNFIHKLVEQGKRDRGEH